MKTCPQCGREAADAAKWCIRCRHSFESGADARPAVSAGGGCPICRGPAGAQSIRVRKIGETRKHGVPLVLTVSVTAYEQVDIGGICSSCGWRMHRGRWLAWGLALLPAAAVFVAAAVLDKGFMFGAGLIAGMFAFRGLFYSWVDTLVWGERVVAQLALPPGDYEIPARARNVLLRALVGPYLLVLAVAFVASRLG